MKSRPCFVKNAPPEDHGFQNWIPQGSMQNLCLQVLFLAQLLPVPRMSLWSKCFWNNIAAKNVNKENYIHHSKCCFLSVALSFRQNTLTLPNILYSVGVWSFQIWGSLAVEEYAPIMVALTYSKHHQTCIGHLLWLIRTLTGHDGEYKILSFGPYYC